MNHESNDFAAYRFTPRVARDNSTSWAVEHFKPERWRHLHEALRWLAAVGGAALIGILIGKGL